MIVPPAITQIFALVIMLLVMDILFFIFVPGSWMAYQENNTVWNNLRGMHGFAIFLSVIIFILKVHNCIILVAPIIFHIHASETAYSQMKAFPFFIIYTVLSMHKYLQ